MKAKQIMIVAMMVLVPSLGHSAEPSGSNQGYVYQQDFMPRETVEIDLAKTAMFVTDPQNDFLSKESPAWGLVGPTVIKNKVVEKEKRLKALAKGLGIPVFYSTHMYTQKEISIDKNIEGTHGPWNEPSVSTGKGLSESIYS